MHNADLSDLGGLLCVFLEYKGAAGWLGFALSEASRDPAFGRKEAIIGLPGVMSSVAVATESAHLGQQNAPVGGGPPFANPGKYEIPAGTSLFSEMVICSFYWLKYLSCILFLDCCRRFRWILWT